MSLARVPNELTSVEVAPNAWISRALPSTSPTWVDIAVCASSASRCPSQARRIVSETVAANTSANAASTPSRAGVEEKEPCGSSATR